MARHARGGFAAPPLTFTYYPNPVISHVHPPDGPMAGGTAVTLVGTGFGGASPRLQCQLGPVRLLAEANATDSWLLCVTPPATDAAAPAS